MKMQWLETAQRAPYVLSTSAKHARHVPHMQAALLPDRGMVKVAGSDAAKFLNGLVTADLAKVAVEDLSAALGVLAFWPGSGATDCGLCFADPRLPDLGGRCLLPPDLAGAAAAALGAALVAADAYEAHRIALGVPRGGLDFIYGDAFPHEADMDQLHGVDFEKGCFVGQEVVSRIEHRASARTRVVPVAYDGAAPAAGAAVLAGERNVGMMGSAANGRGL